MSDILETLTRVVGPQMGFVTDFDSIVLCQHEKWAQQDTVIRFHGKRVRVPLEEVDTTINKVEAEGDCLRDVFFDAETTRKIRELLDDIS